MPLVARSYQYTIEDFDDLCVSLDLSLPLLREEISQLSVGDITQAVYNKHPFLHEICKNKNVTLEMVEYVLGVFPGVASWKTDALDYKKRTEAYPLHYACWNEHCPDSVIKLLLEQVRGHSFEFCKVLIDAYPNSVIMRNNDCFPIHAACRGGCRDDAVDTIQYLLELYPESIKKKSQGGSLPIHHAAMSGNAKTIELLLKHDPDGASKVTDNRPRQLPLHIACGCRRELDVVKTLYDAFPQAIHLRNYNGQGSSPLAYARSNRDEPIISFLETQNEYAQKTNDTKAMMTPDENGWLPLHHALKDNAPLGSIKLLVKGNPSAIRIVDYNLAFPLHISCQFSSVKVVRHLVELDSRVPVGHLDTNKDSILHYACRGGNLGVIRYLVDSYGSLVSDINADNKLPFHLLIECEDEQVRDVILLSLQCQDHALVISQLSLHSPQLLLYG